MKIICARRSYVRLVSQIFGILTKELYSGSYQILKYLQFVAICICSWVVLLLVFGCITGLILVSYYTVLRYRVSTVCFFSHFVLSLCPVYRVFLHYLFLAIAFKNNLNFLYIDIKITYLHLALTQIQCILACTPCVDALRWVWVDWFVLVTSLLVFIALVHARYYWVCQSSYNIDHVFGQHYSLFDPSVLV